MPVEEQWITAKDMEAAVKKAKTNRKNKLASFTRLQKRLQNLIDGGSEEDVLRQSYTDLDEAYKNVEKAHEELCLVVEEDHEDAADSYMDGPSDSLSKMQLLVNKTVADKKAKTEADSHAADKRTQYDSLLATFKSEIQNFGKPSASLTRLSAAKTISYTDMRNELQKIESNMRKLQETKAKVVSMDPTADITEVIEQFNSIVTDEVDRCKCIALEYVKDAPSMESSAVTGGGTARTAGFSTTKRETVMLPKFSGEEKTAFLKYPVWRQQWDSHIQEYEHKYRATMLLNHLDAKALEQIIGLETDYDKAVEQLDKYYNDAKKIIKACLDEIRAHAVVAAFDYKALVSYKKCLTNNYTRLKAAGLDHEMSNTAALGVLVRKLPIQEAVKWQEYLAEQDKSKQTKPFPSFMEWLEKAGSSWELLAALGTGAKTKPGNAQVHHSLYAEENTSEATGVSDHVSNAERSGIGRRIAQEVHLTDREDKLVGVKILSSRKIENRQSTRSTTARFIRMLLASGAIRGLALR